MKFLQKRIISRLSLCLSVLLLVTGGGNTYAATVKEPAKVSNQNYAKAHTIMPQYITTPAFLDITTPSYTINGGCEFETYVTINHANYIYAEDLQVQYDTNVFEYIGGDVTTASALKIYNNPVAQNGSVRYIVASKGAVNGLNGNTGILKLRFRAKNTNATGTIQVAKGKIADGNGYEYNVMGKGKNFTVIQRNADVNGDGRHSLGDLAIAGRLYSTSPYEWWPYKPDVDNNYTVDDVDLSCIVALILSSENVTN